MAARLAGAAVAAMLLTRAAPALAEPAWPTLHAALDAPDALKVEGSVRLRYEAIDGQSRVGANERDQLINLRTNLFAEYDFGPLRIGGEIQDARAYLANRGTPISTNEVNAVEPIQAYVATTIGAGRGTLTLKAGRMIAAIGSSRLIANEEFRNTANSFTGVRGDYAARSGASVTAFWFLPQQRLPDDRAGLEANGVALDREGLDTMLWGALATTPARLAGGRLAIGYVGLHERDRAGVRTRRRNLHSLDLRFYRPAHGGKLDWDAEAIYQLGSIAASTAPGAPRLPVDASFYHIALGYTLPGKLGLRLSASYDEASGDRQGRSYNRFDTLYGLRRADFSPAGLYGEVVRSNLRAAGGRVELAPGKRFDTLFDIRALWLASATDAFASTGVRDASGRSGDYAGTQFDMRARYWLIPKALRGEINLDYLAKGRFLKTAPNAPATGDTRYAAVSVTAFF